MIGFFLRIYHLGSQSLWLDEVVQINISEKPAATIIENIKASADNLPPFFHILLHYWLYFGKSEFAMRLLPSILGTASIYLFFLLGRLLFNKEIGLISALLISISSFHIWYSQEVRMYSLVILLSITSVIFFLKSIRENYYLAWSGYVLTTTLGLYTHPYIIFLIIFENSFMVLMWKKYQCVFKKLVLSQVVIGLFYLPWMFIYINLINNSAGFAQNIGIMVFPYTFFAFSVGFSVGPSIAELHLYHSISLCLPYLFELIPVTIIFGVIFIVGLQALVKDKEKAIFLLLHLGIPMLGSFLIVQHTNITYNVRYVCMSLPAYYLILASGISHVKRKGYRACFILLLILCSSFSLNNYYFNEKYAKEDYREVTKYIGTNAILNDVILITAPSLLVPFNYYYSGWLQRYSFMANQIFINSKISNKAKQELQKYRRVWLILGRLWESDPENLTKSYFDKNYRRIDSKKFSGLEVICYEKNIDLE
ncbi:MAG: glycosyltransferase family 39 protein [bacterium]